MKKSIVIISTLAVMITFYITGCNPSDKRLDHSKDKMTEAKKELSEANEEYLTEVKKYRKEANIQIEKNKKSIDEFNARISNVKNETKAEYELKIAELEKKNKEMELKLDQFKGSSEEQWESFKTEFNRDMKSLGDAFRDLTVNNVK